MKIYCSTNKKSFISWLIKKATNSDISHIILGDVTEERPTVLHSTGSGLHQSFIKKVVKPKYIQYSFSFLPAEQQETKEQVKKCFYETLYLLESPYDYLAIVGFIPFLILKWFKFKKTANWISHKFGKKNAIYCSEVLWIFLNKCIKLKIIRNILKDYERETFSPEDAKQLMFSHPDIFKPLKE